MLLRILALCGVAALPLMAENLPECKSDEDKIKGCVEREYYPDSKLMRPMREIPYKNGLQEGIRKDYYNNGNLRGEIPFKHGKTEGVVKAYHESGNLKYEATHKNGKIEGIAKSYYDNGNLERETPVKNGKSDGIAKSYMPNGKLLITITFQEDTAISATCSNGKALNDDQLESIKSSFKDSSLPYKDIAQICGVKLE